MSYGMKKAVEPEADGRRCKDIRHQPATLQLHRGHTATIAGTLENELPYRYFWISPRELSQNRLQLS